MSKRYGRNKKRKHREEIARLKSAYESHGVMLRHVSKELAIAEQVVEDIIETVKSVCVNSIAIPPKNEMGNEDQDFYRLIMRGKIDFSVKDYCSTVPTPKPFYKFIDLYALEVYLKQHAERFQTAVHLRYSAGKRSAYMISEEGLRSMPTHILERVISPDIARRLIQHIKET